MKSFEDKTMLKSILFSLALLTTSGCVFHISKDDTVHFDGSWEEKQEKNRSFIANLSKGIQRSEVLEKLGTPNMSESFSADQKEVLVLFYRTKHDKSDGKTTRSETTPLIFIDDALDSWGNSAYKKISSLD